MRSGESHAEVPVPRNQKSAPAEVWPADKLGAAVSATVPLVLHATDPALPAEEQQCEETPGK